MTTDIQKSPVVTHPLVLLQALIEKGGDPDVLGKMLDLAERWEANQAQKAFALAMNQAQAGMPTILADDWNPQTKSKYPKLETIQKLCKPVYTGCGLSLSFGEGETPKDGHCRITCEVQHVDGYSKHYFLDVPLDGIGIKGNANMTAIHGRLSSDTYAQSRLIRKIFNLTVSNDESDDDGNQAALITPEQGGELELLIREKAESNNWNVEATAKRVCDYLQVEAISKIPASLFDKAKWGVNALKARAK